MGVKNVLNKGSIIPTLQQVTEAGNEIVSDDELFKIVINRNLGSIEIYKREDVGDAFVLVGYYGQNEALIINLAGTKQVSMAESGFSIQDPDFDLPMDILIDRIRVNLGEFSSADYLFPTATDTSLNEQKLAIEPITITSDFTAENKIPYVVTANATVTDPADGFYTVFVQGGTATIGGVGYTSGSLVYRYYNGSVWVTENYKTAPESVRSTATSGTENAPSTSKDIVFIHEAGVTATLIYNFPPSPIDKQKVTIMSVGGITTLTLSASIGAIINAITTLAVGGSATYMYLSSQTKWYKIG